MDVPVTTLRANLSAWLERVRAGEEIVVTERGLPIARVMPMDTAALIARLESEGVIAPAKRPKRSMAGRKRIKPTGSVAQLIIDQR